MKVKYDARGIIVLNDDISLFILVIFHVLKSAGPISYLPKK